MQMRQHEPLNLCLGHKISPTRAHQASLTPDTSGDHLHRKPPSVQGCPGYAVRLPKKLPYTRQRSAPTVLPVVTLAATSTPGITSPRKLPPPALHPACRLRGRKVPMTQPAA